MLYHIFITLFFAFFINISISDDKIYEDDCKLVYQWLIKDLSISQLEHSILRTNLKIELAFLYSLKNLDKNKTRLRNEPKLLALIKSMQELDKNFSNPLRDSNAYKRYRRWQWITRDKTQALNENSLQNLLQKWQKLQSDRPELFSGLKANLHIDSWDIESSQLLDQLSEDDLKLKRHADELKNIKERHLNNYNKIAQENYDGLADQIENLEKELAKNEEILREISKDALEEIFDKFNEVCPQEHISKLLIQDQIACPINLSSNPYESLKINLDSLSLFLNKDFLLNTDKPNIEEILAKRIPPLEIKKIDFENVNYNGSFCERDEELVDTAVIHHSATPNDFTAQRIHNLQVAKSENSTDPWYMIAYNFSINQEDDEVNITQGRPNYVRGAHAGALINLDQVDKEVQKKLLEHKIICGKNTDKNSEHRITQRDRNIEQAFQKALQDGVVNANMTSTGIVLIGNYMPDLILNSRGRFTSNPGGFPRGKTLYPDEEKLKKAGELICKLKQESHPFLRKITDHNFIRIKKAIADNESTSGTCCPGTVYFKMEKIRQYALKACNFSNNEFVLDISPEVRLCHGLRELK